MITELYCRNVNDPGYNPNKLDTSDALEALLTKIRMIIFTTQGEVLGQPSLGLSLEEHLFEFNLNTTISCCWSSSIECCNTIYCIFFTDLYRATHF